MARDSSGPKNEPQYSPLGVPADAADLSEVATYAALVGNLKALTAAQRGALAGSDRWVGLLVSETDTGDLWKYTAGGWKRLGGDAIAVKLRRAAGQALTTGSFTTISWDNEVFDTRNMWAIAAPTRLVAPVPGIYAISGMGGLASAIGGRIAIQWRKNGSAIEFGGALGAAGATEVAPSASTLVSLAANDYMEMQMYHEGGGSPTTGGSGYSQPTVSMMWVGAN
jgi:hypothetical protein